MKEIYKKKKLDKDFDAIVYTKLQYFTIFKSYYNKSSYGPFKDIFKETKNYDELLIEQNNYLKYKELEKTYTKKIKVTKLSFKFSLDLIVFVRLENKQDEWKEYLEKRLKEEFSENDNVNYYNLEEEKNKFFDLWVENEKHKHKPKKKVEKIYYDEDEDEDNYNNNNYSDDNRISNYYDNDNDNENYSYDDYRKNNQNNKIYSRNNNYNSTSRSNTYKTNNSKNTSNKKQKVKVIMCYSCKGKNRCPLCGTKITSRVTLGNLYAHSNCYNEGTCCLCNKKGPGNQVQSICSNCRKNNISKGLTGSARCFICRKLI